MLYYYLFYRLRYRHKFDPSIRPFVPCFKCRTRTSFPLYTLTTVYQI
jgi:hypothetical protein